MYQLNMNLALQQASKQQREAWQGLARLINPRSKITTSTGHFTRSFPHIAYQLQLKMKKDKVIQRKFYQQSEFIRVADI